jgi:pheromone shutdown protein TraB
MTFELIIVVAVVLAGIGAAIRLTIVGFGVTSAILVAGLILWTLSAGIDAAVVGFGLWLLFNASFILSGVALAAFGGRLGQWRSRPISMKDAKGH